MFVHINFITYICKLLSTGTLPGCVVINQCWRLRQCALIIVIIHVYHYDLFMLIVMSYLSSSGMNSSRSGKSKGISLQVRDSLFRDSGEKSFSKKKCEKRAGAGERQGGIFLAATAPFPKSRASYFRFARFNTSALYYLRAWHRVS